MKIVKIVLGICLGLGAVVTLLQGLREIEVPMISNEGLTELGATIGASGLYAIFAAWSFQSAFKKSLPPEDDSVGGETTNVD